MWKKHLARQIKESMAQQKLSNNQGNNQGNTNAGSSSNVNLSSGQSLTNQSNGCC